MHAVMNSDAILCGHFFASMEITELGQFVFPFFTQEPYGYFPGMLSVFLLAPMAWYSMWSLSRNTV